MNSASNRRWMIFGAYGTTGRLVAHEALARGLRPLLAGRDPERLADVGHRTGLETLAVSLSDPAAMAGALARVDGVLNAAGPAARTGPALRRLALDARVSYVDLCGELGDFSSALAADALAKDRAVAVIPGAGFGVVYGEALAAHVTRRLPHATRVRLSISLANAGRSRGAALSTVEALAAGGAAVRAGQIVEAPVATPAWVLRDAGPRGRPRRFASVPRAELEAVRRTSGAANVDVGVPLGSLAGLVLRLASRPLARVLLAVVERRRPRDGRAAELVPSSLRSRIWAEAWNDAGGHVASVLETGEGYKAAAVAAVRVMERTLAESPVGAATPVGAFGPDLAFSLDDVRVTDL